MLICSANDAANVLAEHIGGSLDNFATMLNEKAIEIGCTSTNFVNANGVHNKNHYSTARDLSLIGKYAMKYDTIMELVVQTSCSLPATTKYTKTDRIYPTTNELLVEKAQGKADNYYYPYCTGLKTGYTSYAGNTLIASASRDNINLILVVLNGRTTKQGLSQRYLDSITLFNYGFNNYSIKKIQSKNDCITSIEIANAAKWNNSLDLIIENDITALVSNDNASDIFLPEINLNENIEAPINEGDILGTVEYSIDGIIYSSNLLASKSIEKFSFFKSFGSIILKILLILIILFVILTILKNYNSRKEIKRLRAKRKRF